MFQNLSPQENEAGPYLFLVEPSDGGLRLDRFLASQLSHLSRAHLRRVIDAGGVTVDGQIRKPSFLLAEGQSVRLEPVELAVARPEPENIPLDILFEDLELVVVNKRPRMVVHAGSGNWHGTLAAALAFHFDSLSSIAGATRPGIVHRLDRDTSGAIIIAKSDQVHAKLAAQFKARTVEKEYLAIVVGTPDRDRDRINRPIGAHPTQRQKMAIRDGHPTSRDAETFYEVVERFDGYALVRARPKTGRTHQIRVHLASIGHPVLCDRLYGGRAEITEQEIRGRSSGETWPSPPGGLPSQLAVLLDRQALHAHRLSVDHPATGDRLTVVAPWPDDMLRTIDRLRSHRSA